MAGLGRLRILPIALVALILASTAQATSSIVNFDFYPEGARDCLYSAAKSSQCESKTVEATNACFCRNGGDFITTAAACIGRSSRNDLETTYTTMHGACEDSETSMTINKDEFMEAAEPPSSTTIQTSSATGTETTSTVSSTSPPADDEDGEESSGLSTGALVGIIVGVIAALGLVGASAFVFIRRRRRTGEESHPMLPQHAHHSMVPSASDTSTAYYGSPVPDSGAWPKKDWGASSDFRSSVRASGFNWESASQLAYPASTLAPSPPLPVQELDGQQHFPPGSTQAPVEMGGTPVMTTPPQAPNTPQYQAYNPGQQSSGLGRG
ncbi:hypothetical protein VTI28DRAFT_10214 [Corynascus sepedonium]